MLTFFILWIVLGIIFQVVTLPLALIFGLRNQWHWAGTAGLVVAAVEAFIL